MKIIAGFFQPFSYRMGCDVQALACFSGGWTTDHYLEPNNCGGFRAARRRIVECLTKLIHCWLRAIRQASLCFLSLS